MGKLMPSPTRKPKETCKKFIDILGKRYHLIKEYPSRKLAQTAIKKDKEHTEPRYAFHIESYYVGINKSGSAQSDERGYQYGVYMRSVPLWETM